MYLISNNLTNNNPSFGAQLKINDKQGILKGVNRIKSHRLSKTHSFTEQELKQIESSFEEKTKGQTGKMELKVQYDTRFGALAKENNYLFYSSKKNNGFVSEITSVKFLSDMPKTVDEFVDNLVGAFDTLKNRFKKTQKINKLNEKIFELRAQNNGVTDEKAFKQLTAERVALEKTRAKDTYLGLNQYKFKPINRRSL